MATYTEITEASLSRFIYMFELGALKHFQPIAEGIENSNYYVHLDGDQKFVLTISEDLEFSDVAFFNDLFQQLANGGLPVPEPQRTLDGMASAIFKGKPTWLFSHLSGTHAMAPNAAQCEAIGGALALIHRYSENCRYSRPNTYDARWASQSYDGVVSQLGERQAGYLREAIDRYEDLAHNPLNLPRGIIHGDLFRDNALFEEDELSGVIDFYHACEDYLLQDIAVTINDWCIIEGRLNEPLQTAVLRGYSSVRPMTDGEHRELKRFQIFSAMRFALTRLMAGSDKEERQPGAQLELLEYLLTGG